MIQPSLSRAAGLTLIELVVAVSVVGIIAAGVVPLVRNVPESASLAKLEGDVATINRAVQVYRTHGGSLDGVRTAQEVIDRLKSKADSRSAAESAGLTGSMIDPRIALVMQTAWEGASGKPRATWNAERQRFEVVTSGPRGVKTFALDESLAALPVAEESRRAGMKLATQDRWIWDYDDSRSEERRGPTAVPTGMPGPKKTTEDPTPAEQPPVPDDPQPQSGPDKLKAPVLSIPSGEFPVTQFALPVYLYNTNPAGTSRILYAVNGGGWRVYEGSAVFASPGYTVAAYAEAIDPQWINSDQSRESYRATPVELDPPIITASALAFDFGDNKIVEVTLRDSNKAGVSAMEYRVSGTQWVSYAGPFRMHVDDNPIGAVIEAKAVPTEAYYLESDVSYLNIDEPAPWFSISGGSQGVFANPAGEGGLVTNLARGVTSEFFTWGVPSGTDNPSSLQFTGADFFDITPGERFLVGVLDYYNGTIRSGSGADTVDLSIDLAFEGSLASTFEFTLDLINTPNGGSRERSADYVLLGNIASQTATTISGRDFNLILEFGETTDGGFASVDQFHVFEDARASGNLFARLELVK